MNIVIAQSTVVAYVLALTRSCAWVFVCPPFGTRMVPVQIKLGFSAALALALGPKLVGHAVPLEPAPLISAAALQVGAGLALGFLGVMIFSAVQAAGSLIDLFGGFSMAHLLDPLNGASTSVFGRFYNLLAITLLFAIDGHLLLVRGFLTSFDAAPLTSLSTQEVGHMLTSNLSLFFIAALEIAAPLVAALFLADMALGLLARVAPEMNVFLLGLPLKVLLVLFLAGVTLPLLPDAVSHLTRTIVEDGAHLLGAR
jgi:flagellar biosynthetic protein FliR